MNTPLPLKRLLFAAAASLALGALFALLPSGQKEQQVDAGNPQIVLPAVPDRQDALLSSHAALLAAFVESASSNEEPANPSATPLFLIGLVQEGNRRKAILSQSRGDKQLRSYQEGDTLPNAALLKKINEDGITIILGEETQYLRLYPGKPEQPQTKR